MRIEKKKKTQIEPSGRFGFLREGERKEEMCRSRARRRMN